MKALERRSMLKGMGIAGAGLFALPSADVLGLDEDRIKTIRYFLNSGDTQGGQGQPMTGPFPNRTFMANDAAGIFLSRRS